MLLKKYLFGPMFGLAAIAGLSLPAKAEVAEVAEVADVSEVAAVAPDRIVLKNGSTILGTVTGSRDNVVSIDTDFAGTLSVALDKIASMQTSAAVTIQLADETVITDQPLLVDDEQLVVTGAVSPEQNYAITDLLVVNPEPWELGQGYKWSGLVSLAMSMERGNTDSDELDYKLESIWRSKIDRYTLKFDGETDENNGEKTVEKWSGRGKYDYFIDGPVYLGLQASAEHDKFKDLDLRYLVGPFIGRQFYDEPIFSFSGEVGASYVNEDFIEAEDQDYPSANWALNASSNYLGGDSRLYFDNIGILSLDDTSDVVINTTFGLSFPLLFSLEAAAEVLLEYDSGAVEGVDDLDQTYRFRVGYSW
jgi:Protein of unknown function, DUF481